jgi:4-hydroxythreonine-4-phosphate dehydrogenase
MKKRLAITLGDPAGIGPELCLHLLAHPEAIPGCEAVVVGDATILRRVARALGRALPENAALIDRACFSEAEAEAVVPGRVSAACGGAALDYIDFAIAGTLAGDFDALVTAPINKEALRAAGIDFPGHTEILAHRTDAARSCMMQYSDEITCTFVTCHCGYADVPDLLTHDRLLDVIELTHDALSRIKGRPPLLVACGLNPHAGEHGLFGAREEETRIIPALEAARARGIDIRGPVPPDTAFIPSARRTTDCVVCMYHDQGHIPLKALAFDRAVNVTLGLPIIRTSVDHGTAFDIAWQGKANPGSLIEAVNLAVRLAGET